VATKTKRGGTKTTTVARRRSTGMSVADQQRMMQRLESQKRRQANAKRRANEKKQRIIGAGATAAGGLAGGWLDRWQEEQTARGEGVFYDVVEGVPAETILGAGVWAVATFAFDKSDIAEYAADLGVGMVAYGLGKLGYNMANQRYSNAA
jgi:hypothetical protein